MQDAFYAAGLPLIIVIPLTSATTAARFAGTLTIEPSAFNGLRKTSVALVFQIRAVDRKIVRERIGTVWEDKLAEIYELVDRLTDRTHGPV